MQVYSLEEVQRHDQMDDLWIVFRGNVYDLTMFVQDHPGGVDSLMDFAGKDISGIMGDSNYHAHSDAAFQIMDKYMIGRTVVGAGESGGSQAISAGADEGFLDLKRPLLWQLLTKKNLTKEHYLRQVHIGRHFSEHARLFENPILERLSHTPWWIIPTIWLPVCLSMYLEARSVHSPFAANALFCFGVFLWTLLEYGFHRFIFHFDQKLPENVNNILYTGHFLIHSVHHFLPMDKDRLVMPPALFSILFSLVWFPVRLILTFDVCCGLLSGGLLGYVIYDMLHYFSHHGASQWWVMRWLKKYHMDHHYKHPDKGFGVSSPLWDIVFGTEIKVDKLN